LLPIIDIIAELYRFLRATAYMRPSVCLSVCHTGGSYKNGWSGDYETCTIW